MERRYFVVLSLIALLIPGAALAADPGKQKTQKTKGEIVSVGEDCLQLKTKKATITVLLTQKPRIVIDRVEMSPAALKQGARVTVVGTTLPSGEVVASEIQLPAPQAPSPALTSSGHSAHAH